MKTATPGAESAREPRRLSFHTKILQTGANTTGIRIPAEIVEGLGAGKQPLVCVTLNGYTYRSAVAVMSGAFMVGLSAENRQASGVHGGDELDVIIELDLQPRTVTIPEDLLSALSAAGRIPAFEAAAPSMRKEYVRQVEEAKTQETRERRIAKIVEKLSAV